MNAVIRFLNLQSLWQDRETYHKLTAKALQAMSLYQSNIEFKQTVAIVRMKQCLL